MLKIILQGKLNLLGLIALAHRQSLFSEDLKTHKAVRGVVLVLEITQGQPQRILVKVKNVRSYAIWMVSLPEPTGHSFPGLTFVQLSFTKTTEYSPHLLRRSNIWKRRALKHDLCLWNQEIVLLNRRNHRWPGAYIPIHFVIWVVRNFQYFMKWCVKNNLQAL